MARGNNVTLYGLVIEKPMISIDNETGDYNYGVASVRVVRGARNAKDGRNYAVFSYPKIYTRNPDFVKEMEIWEVNDIVNIVGTFNSTTINKTSECTSCHMRNRRPGSFGYIEPTFVHVNDHCESPEEGLQLLKHYIMVSNSVTVIGDLAKDPRRMTLSTTPSPDGRKRARDILVCEYPIISHRLLHVAEDPAEKKEDLLWVKTYGVQVDRDYFRLQKSSEVYIDGCLQTRYVRRHAVCDHCGQQYDWRDSTMEVVPYETEYLQRFRTKEEAELLKKERREQSAKDILARLKSLVGENSINETEISEGEISDETDEQLSQDPSVCS